MRFLGPLLAALILVPPASAVPLQDLLVPGTELDAGRLHFTDFSWPLRELRSFSWPSSGLEIRSRERLDRRSALGEVV